MSMHKGRLPAATVVALAAGLAVSQAVSFGADDTETFGFGQDVTQEQIDAFNIRPSVAPDGEGLPPGSGTVTEGQEIYLFDCSSCHGPTGQEGPMDTLVGTDPPPVENPARRPIGSYWQYATTLFDYVQRAMPFDRPGSLEPDQVYAVVAYLLYANDIISEGEVMNADTLPHVNMPAAERLIEDPRWPPNENE